MFLIDDDETENSEQGWLCSFEETVMNILTSVGFVIALVLIAVNVEAATYNDDVVLNEQVELSDVQRGSLLFKSENRAGYSLAPIIKTDVIMKVSGMIVRTIVKQNFKNDSSEWLEGIYVFPLPESAAVDHMNLRIGERTIEGQIKERAEATQIYNAAKKQGKKAALITQQRPNLFTNKVANIGPGEQVMVEIEYQQVLKYDNGQFKIRFPTTITPRYVSQKITTLNNNIDISESSGWAVESQAVSGAEQIPTSPNIDQFNALNIDIELNAGFPVKNVSSSYHEIKSIMHLEGQYTVSLVNKNIPSDRDFELVWQPELGSAPQAALFTQTDENQDYHFIMLMPPNDTETNKQVLARDVTYIIDTSGSMYGESLRQAKAALQLAISRLRTFDKFNIIEFDSNTNQLFSDSRLATSKNAFIAKNFVNRLTADGGTEMKPALLAAFNSKSDNEYIRQIIFLTDGSVANEAELFHVIKTNLGNSRLFTIAIGSSPNSHFMTKAANFGRGTYTYIGKVAEVREKMSALFSKLEKPVMQKLNVKWPNDSVAEIWPKRLPDLYAGEPLMFTARLNKHKNVIKDNTLLITGQRNQQTWQVELPLNNSQENSGVAVLWARNKIASIMDAIRDFRDNSTLNIVNDLKQKIINIALAHHLVSKYTSLVAVDTTPSRPIFEGLKVASVTNSVSRGSVTKKVLQGSYAQTATSGQLHLIIGLMLLLLGFLLVMRHNTVVVNRYHNRAAQ